MTHPLKLPIQIIGPTTLQSALDAYRKVWGREWPHSKSHLATLIVEAKADLGLAPGSKAKPTEVREAALVLMRLDHEFDASPAKST